MIKNIFQLLLGMFVIFSIIMICILFTKWIAYIFVFVISMFLSFIVGNIVESAIMKIYKKWSNKND